MAQQAKGTSVRLNWIIREFPKDAVEGVEADPSYTSFAAGTPHRTYDFRALFPRVDQRGNYLRRVLQIGVHRDGGIGGRRPREAGRQCALKSEITREFHQ